MKWKNPPDVNTCHLWRHSWASRKRSKICVFSNFQWYRITWGISNILFLFYIYFILWTYSYITVCTIILIQAICVLFHLKRPLTIVNSCMWCTHTYKHVFDFKVDMHNHTYALQACMQTRTQTQAPVHIHITHRLAHICLQACSHVYTCVNVRRSLFNAEYVCGWFVCLTEGSPKYQLWQK